MASQKPRLEMLHGGQVTAMQSKSHLQVVQDRMAEKPLEVLGGNSSNYVSKGGSWREKWCPENLLIVLFVETGYVARLASNLRSSYHRLKSSGIIV
jgi:hypothetical protein